jgi:hypothetical protein
LLESYACAKPTLAQTRHADVTPEELCRSLARRSNTSVVDPHLRVLYWIAAGSALPSGAASCGPAPSDPQGFGCLSGVRGHEKVPVAKLPQLDRRQSQSFKPPHQGRERSGLERSGLDGGREGMGVQTPRSFGSAVRAENSAVDNLISQAGERRRTAQCGSHCFKAGK